MDEQTRQLMAPLQEIDPVYRNEDFDSLTQVMQLLSDSSPEQPKAQRLKTNEATNNLGNMKRIMIFSLSLRKSSRLDTQIGGP